MVRMPDGQEVPYWNTFYQEVKYNKISRYDLIKTLGMQYVTASRIEDLVNKAIDEGKVPNEINFEGFDGYREAVIKMLEDKRCYLGQMDLNIKSPLVWEFYDDTLKKLKEYGAEIVRLDAYYTQRARRENFLMIPNMGSSIWLKSCK